MYTGSSSGIPVYTGPASVHWLRVREAICLYKRRYLNPLRVASGNGVYLTRHQTITQANVDTMPIQTTGTNFNQIGVNIRMFSIMK